MRLALINVLGGIRDPVAITLCSELQEKTITIRDDKAETLDRVLQSVAAQVGVRMRLYVGEHGELAHPTFTCISAANGPWVTLPEAESGLPFGSSAGTTAGLLTRGRAMRTAIFDAAAELRRRITKALASADKPVKR